MDLNSTAKIALRLGDLILFKDPFSFQNTGKEKIGVFLERKNNIFQILLTGTDKNHADTFSIKVSNQDLVEGKLPVRSLFIFDRTLSLEADSIFQKVGRIGLGKIDELLRRMIHKNVEKHYQEVHAKNINFIPGETYIRYAGRVYDEKEMISLVDSALDFWLTEGRFTRQLEKEFASFLDVPYCLFTNSGSSANLLAISALTSSKLGKRSLKPGDEVITTACAFPTTVSPIIQNGLIPVFLDVGIGTYNIAHDKIEEALSERTMAIFLAHTLGNPFDIEAIASIANKYKLWLIEDNCDALGSRYGGKYTGTFGDISTFSFYPAHHMTMGEGGAVTTADAQLKKILSSFKDWGRDCWCEPGHDNTCGKRFSWQLGKLPYGYDHKFIYSQLGYNLKITDMQAAVGIQQLKKLSRFIEARDYNWEELYKNLKKYQKYFYLPEKTKHSNPSWFGFILTVKENAPFSRNDIVNYLEKNKIATRNLFSGNIIRHPCFDNVSYRVHKELENTDYIMNNTFWIGVYPGLKKDMVSYIIRKFGEFWGFK
ncbi:lipopolysaccharide biosynthesis protein RfbH [Acidobacteriota bacterium]